ncbi:hypothetical protein HPB50_009329 [Hyalomma asiaticum]|uniref:Uncharacterized protein n=1 Tax=Hyalomma asiaticum TaxID=266040 RepID=A0ACB7S511_HYAAI|nr:hypothetical protein HPB50_009329 [Hyalomma asiaticum]
MASAARAHWTHDETFALIRLWQDNLNNLRKAKRNANVYAKIVEELLKLGITKTLKETKTKIENLGNKYRQIVWNMENGETVPEENAVIGPTEPQSPVQDDNKRTKEKELQLDKAAGEREERLISILEKLIQK